MCVNVLVIGPDHLTCNIQQSIFPLALNVKPSSKDLGVIFNPQMKFEHHVRKLTESCFFPSEEYYYFAFVSSHLDYCNALFTCLSKSGVERLQLVVYCVFVEKTVFEIE